MAGVLEGKIFWRFSVFICFSVARSYIIIRKIYSFKLKNNLQKLMRVKGEFEHTLAF